jgi:hypothetical protein
MSEYRDKINLDDLFERNHKLTDLRTNIYKKILNRVHAKIKYTSRQRNSGHFCFFIIPEFLVGTPRYDSAACIAYIMDKLIENNFIIKYTHPNLLFISWKHYIPKYERATFKKKYGYTIDGFGNYVNDKKNKEDGKDNINTLLLKKKDIPINANKKADNNYTQISKYKPTGNLIYNNALLRKIEDSTTKVIN